MRLKEPQWGISPCLQLHLEFSYRVQPLLPHVLGHPHLPVDVTLGFVPHSVMAPTTLKFVQKMLECVKRAHKVVESFQVKEAQCHKLNYDKRSKAATLEVGDTVLVDVTAFKDHHKIQN